MNGEILADMRPLSSEFESFHSSSITLLHENFIRDSFVNIFIYLYSARLAEIVGFRELHNGIPFLFKERSLDFKG